MNTYQHFTYAPKPALLTRVANGLIVGIAALVRVFWQVSFKLLHLSVTPLTTV